MGEVLGSTHSEFTPVQISHKSDMKRPEPRQDVEGAVERLESVMRYNSSYGPVLVHADHDLRALLTDWRQRGEEIERMREERMEMRIAICNLEEHLLPHIVQRSGLAGAPFCTGCQSYVSPCDHSVGHRDDCPIGSLDAIDRVQETTAALGH